MRIIITGGSGFIGTNLVEYYVDKGHIVLNLDKVPPKNHRFSMQWVPCNINDYYSLLSNICNFEPDYIIHLAARTDLEGKSVEDYSANTLGVENILKVAAQIKGLRKILITSSMLVCHTGYIPKDQYDYSPTTAYGESKVITDKIVWSHKPKCDWAILRPTSVWGPWFGIPYRNFFDLVKGGLYVHSGHRSCRKTYGYVENVVYQIDQILHTPTLDETNKVFYLGDTPAIYIEEWADQIAQELGKKVRRVPFCLMRLAAWVGDFLSVFNMRFPMTSFRLHNMTTDNIVPLDNTVKVAPQTPVDRITGIKRTLAWMENVSKQNT